MGMRSLVCTGGPSSTGSPITLRMRPRHSGPTGIAIGAPVSRTIIPRTRPSVVSMATARMVLSPRWAATSSVRLSVAAEIPGLLSFRALRILGSFPSGNSTSTTGPMTWTTLPRVGEVPFVPSEADWGIYWVRGLEDDKARRLPWGYRQFNDLPQCEQLDFEHQRRMRWNHGRKAPRAVGEPR